jgi:hypothetical protein
VTWREGLLRLKLKLLKLKLKQLTTHWQRLIKLLKLKQPRQHEIGQLKQQRTNETSLKQQH